MARNSNPQGLKYFLLECSLIQKTYLFFTLKTTEHHICYGVYMSINQVVRKWAN